MERLVDPLTTIDAKLWADEFMKVKARLGEQELDHAMMLVWFANAIMQGYDEGQRRAKADAQATIAALQADPYKQGFIDALEKVASDWASKEFRGHDEIQGVEVQAFLDTRHVHYEECRGMKPLQSQLTQCTANLEALQRERDRLREALERVLEQWVNGRKVKDGICMEVLVAAKAALTPAGQRLTPNEVTE